MQSRRAAMALGTPAVIAFALLLGPAGLGHGEQSAEAVFFSEVKKLLPDPGVFDLGTVAVSGDTAVVGKFFSGGAAYVFGRDEGGTDNWGEVTKLTASDAQARDEFGIGVAVSGDTVVVGANGQDAAGTRIAYATYEGGPGPPLVNVYSWLVSQEMNWETIGGRAIFEALAEGRRLFSFDRRGIGASQREVDDLSLEAHVADLAAVVDHLGLERFDLVGWVDGGSGSCS